ncbi:MAG TPA: hypothetical protein VK020_15710 [Microlunatus sp.]|nr:hypothetical protein [Microlunatus sp.]
MPINGSPGFGQYRPDGDRYRPFALVVLDLRDGRIAGMTTFLDSATDFPRFGLPAEPRADEFPRPASYHLT